VKTVRCRSCSAEFTDAEIEGLTACPACGSKRAPVSIANDVAITLNWFEWRLLANWADRWGEHCLLTDQMTVDDRAGLDLVLERIRAQRPDGAPGLTLRDEMGQLHDAGINASLHDSAGAALVKPPTKH